MFDLSPAFRTLSALILGAGFLSAAGEAEAARGEWLDHGEAKVRLISSVAATGSGERLDIGLQFKLQPGWKIYWRSPGDAGFPPSLDWGGSENLAQAEMRWPVPERFSLFGLETFGYGDEVVLPIEAGLSEPGAPLALHAKIGFLVCEEICIPYSGEIRLDLPAGDAERTRHALLIDQFQALVPDDGSRSGLSLETAALSGPTEAPVLEVAARSEIAFESPDLIVEGPPGFVYPKPTVSLSADGKEAAFEIPVQPGPAAKGVLEGKRLILTLTDIRRGLEAEVIARHDAMPASLPGPGFSATFLTVLAIALLGGLILNLMPCVLPVLSLKLLAIVNLGGRARQSVRLSFLATTAGILVSFLLLAAGAVALQATGMTVGWGIQFQQPLFLSAMALIVTFFALNLFGLFEITLPAGIMTLAATSEGQGDGKGLAGDFSTGVFATLLATPCSAPFVGTAVAFALSRGALEIFAIFTALGLGLALPYLLVAALPGLASRLPRPGPWMIRLRQILGLALLATAVWLLSVLAAQLGLLAALLVGALLAVIGLLFFLKSSGQPARLALIAALALATVALPAAFDRVSQTAGVAEAAEGWEPFDPARIAAVVGDGGVVFVDVTADWCITCQVNKKLVIDRDPVASRLAGDGIVAMRADWTQPSQEISDYLESFSRYGIPFNAVYGPGLPEGEALGELLSSESVIDVLNRAGTAGTTKLAED